MFFSLYTLVYYYDQSHGACMTHIGCGCTGNSFLHHLTGICGVIDGTYRYSRELLALDACRGSPTS